MHLIDQAPWEIARTIPHGSLKDDVQAKRMAFVSRESALTNLEEEVDRELSEAQGNFATVFNASPAILCIIQLDGLRYREINRGYEECTGYSRSEVLGKTSLKLGLWSNTHDRNRIIQKLLTEGRLSGRQAVFRTKKGERLTTVLSAEIMEFRGEQCALVIAEDITMRRQAEEARVDVAERLINAQEAEYARVAGELEKTRLTLADLRVDSNSRLIHLRGKLNDLGRVVGNLSHQLSTTTSASPWRCAAWNFTHRIWNCLVSSSQSKVYAESSRSNISYRPNVIALVCSITYPLTSRSACFESCRKHCITSPNMATQKTLSSMSSEIATKLISRSRTTELASLRLPSAKNMDSD